MLREAVAAGTEVGKKAKEARGAAVTGAHPGGPGRRSGHEPGPVQDGEGVEGVELI